MIDKKELRIRNIVPLEYFKSYRFRIEFPNKMTGTLIYIREHYNGYDPKVGDGIDLSLKTFLEGSFGGVKEGYQSILIVEEQLEDALKVTKGGLKKDVIFYFMPRPTYELFEKHQYDGGLNAIAKQLSITFMTSDNDSVNHAVQDEYITYIDIENIPKLKTLKKI
jgi:hypothetical protein